MTISGYIFAGGAVITCLVLTWIAGYASGYSAALKWAGQRLDELYSRDQ